MPSFDELFSKTDGRIAEYNGRTLSRLDYLPVHVGDELRLTFESFGSEWRQGVGLKLKGKGSIVVDGQDISQPIRLWQDTAPRQVPLLIKTKGENALLVHNVWDTGNGTTDAWHNGAAMIVEEIDNGRRYRCNDGHPDENFDDLVFRIEKVLSSK